MIIGEAGQWNIVGSKQNIAGLQKTGGPGHLMREQALDANETGKRTNGVAAARYGQTQAAGVLDDLYGEAAICRLLTVIFRETFVLRCGWRHGL